MFESKKHRSFWNGEYVRHKNNATSTVVGRVDSKGTFTCKIFLNFDTVVFFCLNLANSI
jgi:hypothetical protein